MPYSKNNNERSLLGRRKAGGNSCLRTGLIVFIIIIFISLEIKFLSFYGSGDLSSDHIIVRDEFRLTFSDLDVHDTNVASLKMVPVALRHKFLTPRLRNLTSTLELNGTIGNHTAYNKWALDIIDIKRNIERYNLQQTVYNEDLFGPLQSDSGVIVVQIHHRITYLRHLIVSLAQVGGISQTLLVFSHDYYDEEINELVQSVDFCKVIQIFYPYSIQTHPHEFPGEDPNDCPRNISRKQALLKKCNNARYPDLYGHYREAQFTQTKHHWWWKANRVFNQLEITRNYSGLVVFLEEDHYVAEDFIYVLKLMERACKESCRLCNILSLGSYSENFSYYRNAKKIEITPWISSKHNMGMAFNRSTWMNIRDCAYYFCKYDDYNWDWSLHYTSKNCLKDNNKFLAMVVRGPRVFHIGEWYYRYIPGVNESRCTPVIFTVFKVCRMKFGSGVHQMSRNCESTTAIYRVQKILKMAKRHLYPNYLTITNMSHLNNDKKLKKSYGGWGDHRDYSLCMNMTLE